MQRPSRWLSVLLWSMLLLAGRAEARHEESARHEVTQEIRRVVHALEQGNLPAALTHWLPDAPDRGSVRRLFQERLAVGRMIEFRRLAFGRWNVAPRRTRLRLFFQWRWREKKTTLFTQQSQIWELEFVRAPGGWKWCRLQDVSGEIDEFALRLAQAGTAEERQQLLRETRDPLLPAVPLIIAEEAVSQASQGAVSQAERQLDFAMDLAVRLRDPATVGLCWWAKARMLTALRRFADAAECCRKGLAVVRPARQYQEELALLTWLGTTCGEGEMWPQAEEAFTGAHRLAIQLRDANGLHDAWLGRGLCRLSVGQYTDALSAFEEAAKYAARTGDLEGRGRAIGSAAQALRLAGELSRAYARYQSAIDLLLPLAEADPNKVDPWQIRAAARSAGVFLADHAMIRVDLAKENAPKSYQELERSFKLLHRWDLLVEIAHNFMCNAYVLARIERFAEARRVYELALEQAQEAGHAGIERDALANIASMSQLLRDYPTTLDLARQAIERAEPVDDFGTLAFAHQTIGRARAALGDYERAAAAYRESIRYTEKIRTHVADPALRVSFFHYKTSPYHELAACLVRAGGISQRAEELFEVSERAKARTLLELSKGVLSNIHRTMSARERTQEQRLLAEITAAREAVGSFGEPGREARDPKRARLARAYTAHADFLFRLYRVRPDLQAWRGRTPPATLSIVRERFFSAVPRACILTYVSGMDETLVVSLRRGDPGEPVRIRTALIHEKDGQPLSRARLGQLVQDLRDRCGSVNTNYREAAERLYRVLIEPVEDEVDTSEHLVLIPDGPLVQLPFQVLRDPDGEHLIEKYSVSYAPSVAALMSMMDSARQRSAPLSPGDVLAIGKERFEDHPEFHDRELAGFGPLARRIGGTKGALTGTAATETQVKATLGHARAVLVATHAVVNEVAPMASWLVLGKSPRDDGRLYASELLQASLNARVVALIACETARGQPASGEGLMGLTWVLFVAGSPGSVVTQWSVRSDSAAVFAGDFWRNGFTPGKRLDPFAPARALQAAQRRLMKDERFAHPFHWAPFILVGN